MDAELKNCMPPLLSGGSSRPGFWNNASPTVMCSAVFRDPSFTWRSHSTRRWTWRSVGLLLAATAGMSFYVGRLSMAVPVSAEHPNALKAEPQTASAGSATQQQSSPQLDASPTPIRFSASGVKLEAKSGTMDTAVSTETPKPNTAATPKKGTSNPTVVLLNPSSTEKSSDGDSSKPSAAASVPESTAKPSRKAEAHKAADDSPPAAMKRQAETRSPPRSSAGTAPARRDSVVRRDDAFVPPRIPQSEYAYRRGPYDSAESGDDRARFGQAYPERRYAEDAPPPRTYDDFRREAQGPFQDPRDFRDYRRFRGYDGESYADRRPLLRPMYGPDY